MDDPGDLQRGIPYHGPDTHEDHMMLVAFGALVREFALLESALRSLLCSLAGSKYVAVLAAGQSTSWLIENCRTLAQLNREIDEAQRTALVGYLAQALKLHHLRNEWVHSVWVVTAEGPSTRLSKRLRHVPIVTKQPPTVEGLTTAIAQTTECTVELGRWVSDVLGASKISLDSQLAWEQFRGLPSSDFAWERGDEPSG